MATYSDTVLEQVRDELVEIKNLLIQIRTQSAETNNLLRGKTVDGNVLTEKIPAEKLKNMLKTEDTGSTYLVE